MNQDGLSSGELAEATTAFEREALLLSHLIHPNLPRIHDYFSEHGRSYVVMDYIAGDTLEDYMDQVVQRLPLETVLEIGIQLATVLDYLHNHQPPIIFRDVKPANIMRTADNHVYLIDFGIARHFKAEKAKDTVPLGSKGYAAPEQYGKAQTTPRTDIYGLAATLHELLTGDDPSLGLFHFAPLRANKRKVAPITARLNTLLEQMLEMDMSKRPESMIIVKQELQRILAQQTEHSLGNAPRSSQTRVKRRSLLIGLAGTVATCSLSSAIATLAFNNENTLNLLFAHPISRTTSVVSLAPLAPAQARVLSRPLYTYRGHIGSVTAVTWSPGGQHIASAGTLDSSIQVWNANSGSLLPLSRKSGRAYFKTNNRRVDALAWSPDSLRIAAALDDYAVDVWSTETGDRRPLFPEQYGKATAANALAWSPDGSHIAAISGGLMVEVRSTITGKRASLYTGHTQAVPTLSWSPDGKHIASGGADGTVQVWDAATGDPLFTYLGHAGTVNSVAWQSEPQLLSGFNSCIASGGNDATVQVWSVGRVNSKHNQVMALQGEILIYRGHSGPVTSVSWAPGGQYIASGSEDGTVHVWQAI
jgi:serine/threonine protein kinase